MSHLTAKEKRIKESALMKQADIDRKYSGRPDEAVRARFFAPPYGIRVACNGDKK